METYLQKWEMLAISALFVALNVFVASSIWWHMRLKYFIAAIVGGFLLTGCLISAVTSYSPLITLFGTCYAFMAAVGYALGLTDFVVVADAGLLSRKNIDLLKAAGYKFILAGRIKKESKSVCDWVLGLPKDPNELHETTINGDERYIVSYSPSRAKKDAHNREKGIARLRKAYASGKINKKNINQRGYNKFLVVENDVFVSIDEQKIADDARWDGLKSYVTNTDLDPGAVIERYHELWGVERAFRVVKGQLETRQIFHFTERRIEAHICICFMAYKVYKELERLLKTLNIDLSVDKAMDIAKTISTVTFSLNDGAMVAQTMLTTPKQRLLAPLLPNNN